MTSSVHFWGVAHVKDGVYSEWRFGVCRPGMDLNDDEEFYERDGTWIMCQTKTPSLGLFCSTCAGTGMALGPLPEMRRPSDWGVVGLGQRRHFDHVLGQQAVRHDCGRACWSAAAVHHIERQRESNQDPRRAC